MSRANNQPGKECLDRQILLVDPIDLFLCEAGLPGQLTALFCLSQTSHDPDKTQDQHYKDEGTHSALR
jgi:hypothetical protein